MVKAYLRMPLCLANRRSPPRGPPPGAKRSGQWFSPSHVTWGRRPGNAPGNCYLSSDFLAPGSGFQDPLIQREGTGERSFGSEVGPTPCTATNLVELSGGHQPPADPIVSSWRDSGSAWPALASLLHYWFCIRVFVAPR